MSLVELLNSADLSTLSETGLASVSLLLWLRQGKINEAQTKSTQDLTKMVKEHESRIEKLEGPKKSASKKTRSRK